VAVIGREYDAEHERAPRASACEHEYEPRRSMVDALTGHAQARSLRMALYLDQSHWSHSASSGGNGAPHSSQ
jgi:hypothetical protein